jgi:hypothetical protein
MTCTVTLSVNLHIFVAPLRVTLLCKSNFQFDTRFAESRYKFSFIRGVPQARVVSYVSVRKLHGADWNSLEDCSSLINGKLFLDSP